MYALQAIIVFDLYVCNCLETIDVIDLIYKNGYFLIDTYINGKGKKMLLLDTNSPMLMLPSTTAKGIEESTGSSEVCMICFSFFTYSVVLVCLGFKYF